MPARRIALIAFDGAQLLDVSGPAAVFGAARDVVADAYEVVTVSAAGGTVASSCGVGVATVAAATVDPASVDTLLVVGGEAAGLAATVRDDVLRDWATAVAAAAARIGSVCTGVFVLAGWRLIADERVATHWRATDELRRRFPALRVDAQALYVEDGRLWTSAGITTGIDMALAIVERDLGVAVATTVARRLVLYARRPGHQSQFSTLLEAQGAQGGGFAELTGWIAANLDAPLDVEALSRRAGLSPRSFHRKFAAATGRTPAAFVAALRLERARTLIGDGVPLKRVATASGFGAADRLTRAFVRAYGVAPSTWRALHAGGRPDAT